MTEAPAAQTEADFTYLYLVMQRCLESKIGSSFLEFTLF
jgi:hypothetical protein